MDMHSHQPRQQQIVGKIQGFRRCAVHLRARGDDAIAHQRYRSRTIKAALRAKDPSGANEQILFGHIPLLL